MDVDIIVAIDRIYFVLVIVLALESKSLVDYDPLAVAMQSHFPGVTGKGQCPKIRFHDRPRAQILFEIVRTFLIYN